MFAFIAYTDDGLRGDKMNRKEFERVSPESVGIKSSNIEWLLDRLEEDHTQMHGLMIMRHDKVCAEGWWAPYAPGLCHGLQSLSKTYAATAVGIAYTEGLLDLHTPVIDIFREESPDQPSEFLQHLKVRDVLCMGCGMDEMPVPGTEWVSQFLAMPVNHEPGTVFMYNSLGSSLLGEMIRKLTGLGLQEYLTPRLYEKIGIDVSNHRWICHPDGMEAGGGGLYATTEDNLRLMKLYMNGGVWEGERILAEDYVQLAVSIQNESASEAKVNPPATDNFVGYGFQIWMCKYPGAYRADGAMGQFSICVPDLDMIISVNETAIGAEGVQMTLDYIWEFLKRIDASVESLPEDKEASGHLKRRMKHFALEAPEYTPYQKAFEQYNGKTYFIENISGDNGPGFETQMMKELMGGEFSKGIEQFEFTFRTEDVQIHFVQDQKEHTLRIAVDGTRRENDLFIRGEVVSKVLASGCFEGEDTFRITALWPQTCFTKTISFRFKDNNVEMNVETYPFTTTVPGGTRKWMEPQSFYFKNQTHSVCI